MNSSQLKSNGIGINIIETAQCLNSINRSESDEEMRLELDENSNDSNTREDFTLFGRNSLETNLRNAVDLGVKSNKTIETAGNSLRKSTSNGNLVFETTSKLNKDLKVVQRDNKSNFTYTIFS